MTAHLLDEGGDHCRYPHWEGNRLVVCGKPGYPYCELHAEIVRLKAATYGLNVRLRMGLV